MIKTRPTRAADIRRELDEHAGREYSIDMIHRALGYKEPERQATQQALLLMERQGFVKRAARGRYTSVKAASPVRSPIFQPPHEALGLTKHADADETIRDRMETATAREAGIDGLTEPIAVVNADLSLTPFPKDESEPELDTVKILARSKDGWWIGMGTDGTAYRLEEL